VFGHEAVSVRSGHDPVAVDADVIMTGAVGLAGIGYAWWNRWVSMLHDRTLSDLAAVRDVIEEGAIYLHRVSYAFDRAQREMNDDVERAHAALVEIGPTYDEIAERLKVRLEPHHEVAQKFAGAVEAGLDAARAIERLAVLHLPSIAMGGRQRSRRLCSPTRTGTSSRRPARVSTRIAASTSTLPRGRPGQSCHRAEFGAMMVSPPYSRLAAAAPAAAAV
jgi:hypothetical protein